MNCGNPKCKKEIRNYYTCSKCGKNFCSNSCITDHTIENHSGSNSQQVRPQRMSGMRSVFMKIGQLYKEIVDDPFFNIKNFDLVKNKNKDGYENIGSGAFGDVYLAQHKKDGKYYAIKQMEKIKILESGASLDIIYREISIHRRLNHENIIRLYSHSETETHFFLIMEYSNSGTLFNIIKKQKGIDERTAFNYFIQAVAAVHFLHENNFVHRDLKPENLLLDDKGTVKLCDFGWCVDISTGNRITFCGTYEYMAPEIIKEMPYDYSIDVWSLGILLYELTHGYSPFRAQGDEIDEYNEIFKNIIKYNFKIEKDLSKNCKDLITKLLTPENKNRIRVKDIFFQNWVVDFEKEFKKEKLERIQKEEIENNKNISPGKKVSSNFDSYKISEKFEGVDSEMNSQKEKVPLKKKNSINLLDGGDAKNGNKIEISNKSSSNNLKSNNKQTNGTNLKEFVENSSSNKKLSGNYTQSLFNTSDINITASKPIIKNEGNYNNIQIYNSGMNKSKLKEEEYSEFSILNNDAKDNLFDQVLSQVQKKNTNKKKKKQSTNNTYGSDMNNSKISLNKMNPKESNNKNFKLLEEDNLNEISNISNKKRNEKYTNDDILEENNSAKKKKGSKQYKPSNNLLEEGDIYADLDFSPKKLKSNNKLNDQSLNKSDNKIKDINKELDLAFLPKELLYNDKSYQESNKHLLYAIEVLEKAQVKKDVTVSIEENKETFWSKVGNLFNPFKCGKEDN